MHRNHGNSILCRKPLKDNQPFWLTTTLNSATSQQLKPSDRSAVGCDSKQLAFESDVTMILNWIISVSQECGALFGVDDCTLTGSTAPEEARECLRCNRD